MSEHGGQEGATSNGQEPSAETHSERLGAARLGVRLGDLLDVKEGELAPLRCGLLKCERVVIARTFAFEGHATDSLLADARVPLLKRMPWCALHCRRRARR